MEKNKTDRAIPPEYDETRHFIERTPDDEAILREIQLPSDDQKVASRFSRRELFKKAKDAAVGTVALTGVLGIGGAAAIGIDRIAAQDPIYYPVSEADSEQGLWGIINREFPWLTDIEIVKYINSDKIVNETATEDDRDTADIRAGDVLKLSQP